MKSLSEYVLQSCIQNIINISMKLREALSWTMNAGIYMIKMMGEINAVLLLRCFASRIRFFCFGCLGWNCSKILAGTLGWLAAACSSLRYEAIRAQETCLWISLLRAFLSSSLCPCRRPGRSSLSSLPKNHRLHPWLTLTSRWLEWSLWFLWAYLQRSWGLSSNSPNLPSSRDLPLVLQSPASNLLDSWAHLPWGLELCRATCWTSSAESWDRSPGRCCLLTCQDWAGTMDYRVAMLVCLRF